MGDQDRLAETFIDRGTGVTQMDQKGRAADGGTVDPFRRNAEIVRHFCRFFRQHATPSMSLGFGPVSAIALSAASA